MTTTHRGLAEWAIFYTLGLGGAFFILVFGMAFAAALQPPMSIFAALSVFIFWLFGIAYSTWRIVRSDVIKNAPVSLAPIHFLQFVLVLFTIPSFVVGSKDEMKMIGVILLTWEVFGALFVLSFLVLGVLAGKRIPYRTWLYAVVTLCIVSFSVYTRNRI